MADMARRQGSQCSGLEALRLSARVAGNGRGFCAYVAVFWGIRVALQAVFDVNEHLTSWWWKAGYAVLTLTFAAVTFVYPLAAW